MLLKKLSQTAKYMLISLAALFIMFSIIGALIIIFVYELEPLSKYMLGLFFGCAATAVRLIMMDFAINKVVNMPEKQAKNYHQLMFLLRYGVIIAFAVILIVFNKVFGVYGGVIGIFCMQLSAYGANWLLTRSENKARGGRPKTFNTAKDNSKNNNEDERPYLKLLKYTADDDGDDDSSE